MAKYGVLGIRDQISPKYCCCCHIKTFSMIYGLLCLMANIFILGIIVLVCVRPDILNSLLAGQKGSGPEFDGVQLDKIDEFPGQYENTFALPRDEMCMAFALMLVSIMVTCSFLYGIIANRASYILPFFCVHIFFFCMSCLSVVNYLSNVPHFSIKALLINLGLSDRPEFDYLMKMDDNYFMFLTIIIFILALSIKAYLIGAMWSCYKYVQKVALSRESRIAADSEALLPPDYDESVKLGISGIYKVAAPPLYSC